MYARHTDSLTSSFAQLKKTATCVEDIAEWFKKNPSCIPDMSEIFTENLQVKILSARTMLDPNLEPPDAVTYLTLVVDARVEPSRENSITDDDFERSTGQFIRIQRSRSDAAWYAGEFVLPLLAMQWPMVAAQQAHYVLNKEIAINDAWYTHAQSSWSTNFSHLQWGTLVNLHSASVLPVTETDFIVWAVNTLAAPCTNFDLPQDFGKT